VATGTAETAGGADREAMLAPPTADLLIPSVPPPGSANRTALPLAATLLILGLAYWCVDIVSPALPVVRESLGLNATAAGLVMSAFFGGRLLANLPAALLVDRAGPRTTATVGAAVLAAGSTLAATAGGEALLLPARALQGSGVALLATAGLLSVLRALPAGGAAMTAFNVSAGVGGSFGLYASGVLTSRSGWQGIFWFSSFLGLVMLGAALLARPGRARNRPADASVDEPTPAAAGWTPALFGALAANLLVYGNYAIWIVALPLFAAARFGAGPADIGLVLLIVNAIHLLGAFPVGRVIRLRGAAVSLAVGLATAALGMATMTVVPDQRWLVLPLALYAFGQVAGNSSAGELLLRLGGGGGRAVGLVRLTSDLGLVVGPAAAGMLTDGFGVGAPFVVLALSAAAGAVIAFVVVARKGRRALAIG
jgi:MFS family permease